MAKRAGIVFVGKNPEDLYKQLSVIGDELTDNIQELVEEFLKEAVREMRGYIATRGVKDKVRNNNGRIRSGDMYKDVVYDIKVLASGRVQAQFGWLNDPPAYYLFQEYGTEKNGEPSILDMLALTDAYKTFETKIVDAFHNGNVIHIKSKALY